MITGRGPWENSPGSLVFSSLMPLESVIDAFRKRKDYWSTIKEHTCLGHERNPSLEAFTRYLYICLTRALHLEILHFAFAPHFPSSSFDLFPYSSLSFSLSIPTSYIFPPSSITRRWQNFKFFSPFGLWPW